MSDARWVTIPVGDAPELETVDSGIDNPDEHPGHPAIVVGEPEDGVLTVVAFTTNGPQVIHRLADPDKPRPAADEQPAQPAPLPGDTNTDTPGDTGPDAGHSF